MGDVAGIAAVMATAIAVVSGFPQIWCVLVTGDVAGVSACYATLGIGCEVAWAVYAVQGGLWLVLPEALAMTVANVALVGALARAGGVGRRAVVAGGAWATVLGASLAVGGPGLLAALLGSAYAVQVAPSIWAAYRTTHPTGVSSAAWALIGAESLLWGVYGFAHRDLAVLAFAVVGSGAAAAILARKAATGGRVVVAA